MASTRSKATIPAPAQTPKQAFLTLLRHGARIQIAAGTAAANTLMEWAQTTDRFAQAVADALLLRIDGETDSAGLIARVTTASSAHLHDLTALPRAAADHFDTRLARVPIDS
jgi:hypothetical protein